MTKKRAAHYVSNKELLPEIEKYKETYQCLKCGEIIISEDKIEECPSCGSEISNKASEVLGGMLLKIASNYANKGNFANYTWKRDMVFEAILTCLKYLNNFDINRKNPNPFAYITTICHHAFVSHIKKQKKHSKIKDTCYKKSYVFTEDEQYHYKGINYELLLDKKKKRR